MRIGVDLGGTKTELIALADDGTVRLRRRMPTPAGDYAATVALIAAMVAQAEAELATRASIGIGTPGSVSPVSGLMRNANSTCLNGRPLKQDLEAALGREIRIANDANCFALSEAVDGAGQGGAVVFGVILGTGVGGGVVVNGQVLNGANGIAGEWGHNPLPPGEDGEGVAPACYCGRRGCVETWLSGPALAADHLRVNCEALTPEALVGRAAAGDAACEATLLRYETRLARALAGVINLLDPDVIVLGGGLSSLDRLYRNVPLRWTPHVFSDAIATRLRPPLHGDSSGVRGAAWLW
ncbi:MAG: ROK family protein [Methyloversatilis sp.]|nr:ROK family protein [Methyloversatilis sp.]